MQLEDIDLNQFMDKIRIVSPWFPRWAAILQVKGFKMEEIIELYINSVDEAELMSYEEVYSLFRTENKEEKGCQ